MGHQSATQARLRLQLCLGFDRSSLREPKGHRSMEASHFCSPKECTYETNSNTKVNPRYSAADVGAQHHGHGTGAGDSHRGWSTGRIDGGELSRYRLDNQRAWQLY